MNVNFDEYEPSFKFEGGKRYNLVVISAEEGESANSKPFLKLKLETTDLHNAYEHDIWLTPKALGFAQEWFKALGLPDKGNVNIPSDKVDETLRGIHFTAECYFEPYTVNKGTPDEKTYQNTKWCKPERIAVGAAQEQRPMPRTDDTVPF